MVDRAGRPDRPAAAAGVPSVPAERPTMYFIGVSTAQSWAMRAFPRWASLLGLGDCALAGIDLPLRAPADAYRRVVGFLATDPLSLGAVVTSHKLDLYAACKDLLVVGDDFAARMQEASCLTKRDGQLVCLAKDPLTSGLALRGFVPAGHWAGSDAEALVLGAGGAGTAIAWHLLDPANGDDRPRRVIVTDRRAARLEAVEALRRHAGKGVEVELIHTAGTAGNDAVVRLLPGSSLVVNATGLGKDRAGSPLSGSVPLPRRALAWDLNYRGDLVFLEQARAQAATRDVRAEDGWTYFVHGWTQHIAEIFRLDPGATAARFDELAAAAAWDREPGPGLRLDPSRRPGAEARCDRSGS